MSKLQEWEADYKPSLSISTVDESVEFETPAGYLTAVFGLDQQKGKEILEKVTVLFQNRAPLAEKIMGLFVESESFTEVLISILLLGDMIGAHEWEKDLFKFQERILLDFDGPALMVPIATQHTLLKIRSSNQPSLPEYRNILPREDRARFKAKSDMIASLFNVATDLAKDMPHEEVRRNFEEAGKK